MRRLWTLILTVMLLLSACQSSGRSRATPTGTPGLLPGSRCGDNLCEGGESSSSCPQDCPATAFTGRVRTTFIKSANIGNIAVMVASPQTPRFSDGAGIVVMASPIFSTANGFMLDPDLASLGLIQVSYLWPGEKDAKTGVKSDGQFDYGGTESTQVLTDVLRYAAGRSADADGRYIFTLSTVPPLTDQVGVYAFADAALPVVNAFTINGGQLVDINYFIGNENPTLDTISSMELGYYDDSGQPVYNPLYVYPGSYSPTGITLNYANLRWDPTYTDSHTHAVGRPYLDLDGNRQPSSGDFVFGWRVPVMFGKRYYSAALTKALLDNSVLSLANWPADLATPDEAAQVWQYRQSTDRYKNFTLLTHDWKLRVMLTFAVDDHLQVALDKPHIHQAFQGFRFQGGLWVRLNPDRAYVQAMIPSAGLDFPDNPANTQPTDWTAINTYAYPNKGAAGRLVPLAAVAEMADRAHDGIWADNLGQVLEGNPTPVPNP